TVVSKSKGRVVKELESERQTLGIRIPNHRIPLELIRAFGKPITSTSANTTGKKSPYSWEDLVKYTSKSKLAMIDGLVDMGKLPYREPSTVVDTTLNEIKVLRQGRITIGNNKNKVVTYSPSETVELGKKIMSKYVEKLIDKPLVIGLQGELGAGKTQLVKGV